MFIKRTKKKHSKTKKIRGQPQKKGVISRVFSTNPRKPNSAQRKACKVIFSSSWSSLCAIKGVPHNLKKFSKVWVEGRGFRDTPAISLKLIPNKDSFTFNIYKKKRRSIFGIKKQTI